MKKCIREARECKKAASTNKNKSFAKTGGKNVIHDSEKSVGVCATACTDKNLTSRCFKEKAQRFFLPNSRIHDDRQLSIVRLRSCFICTFSR